VCWDSEWLGISCRGGLNDKNIDPYYRLHLFDKNDVPERLDVFKTWIGCRNIPIRTILETGEMLFIIMAFNVPGGEQYISRILASTFKNFYKYSGAPIYSRHVKSEILAMLREALIRNWLSLIVTFP
jgi:hypothetical protein